MDNTIKASAFTQRYEGVANALKTECIVYPAFDPESGDKPLSCKVGCLWDTGATNTVISAQLVRTLGLKPTGMANVSHTGGKAVVNTYLINIMLPNNVGFPFLRVSEGVLSGFDVLVGMDIIAKGDFSISCANGKTVFSFQTPSTHEEDYVKDINAINDGERKKVGRNALCPCGSGKKYKNCCGKL